MRHATYDEINRRIGICFDLRNAEHTAMFGPHPDPLRPLISPLSPEWAEHAARFDALAAESDALYAELLRRDGVSTGA
jgi:hypothetical protein